MIKHYRYLTVHKPIDLKWINRYGERFRQNVMFNNTKTGRSGVEIKNVGLKTHFFFFFYKCFIICLLCDGRGERVEGLVPFEI